MRYLIAIALWGCFSLVLAGTVADITGMAVSDSFNQVTTALGAINH